jgi:hypothetical protein
MSLLQQWWNQSSLMTSPWGHAQTLYGRFPLGKWFQNALENTLILAMNLHHSSLERWPRLKDPIHLYQQWNFAHHLDLRAFRLLFYHNLTPLEVKMDIVASNQWHLCPLNFFNDTYVIWNFYNSTQGKDFGFPRRGDGEGLGWARIRIHTGPTEQGLNQVERLHVVSKMAWSMLFLI